MKRVAIASRLHLEKHEKTFHSIVRYLKKEKKELFLEKRVADLMKIKKYNEFIPGETEVDLVLVLGGDGTILRVVNKMKDINTKFFGINMGHLGFLSEIPPVQITKSLGRIFAGHYTIDKRMMLQINLERDKKKINKFHALNEVSITQGTLSRLITLKAKVNGKKLANYRSDGLIVSTPTGSTAYNLSAGGPIVYPTMKAIIITPICPHSFNQKPIVIPDNKKVSILVASDYETINLTIDGQQSLLLKNDDIVHVKLGSSVEFIRLPNENYFQTLRQKLGWGGKVEKLY
ncbi:NAD(+)/NADH kinase [Candidatus Peregrinibacteria bacterium]|nr:NAD(+)/NADH kinase [Candidatus Peregrinibacteria bacterium]